MATALPIAHKWPDNRCLGWRVQDKLTGVWNPYIWMDYKTVNKRRTDFGAGIAYLHSSHGVRQTSGGWGNLAAKTNDIGNGNSIRRRIVVCQSPRMADNRSGSYVPIPVYRQHLRHPKSIRHRVYCQSCRTQLHRRQFGCRSLEWFRALRR